MPATSHNVAALLACGGRTSIRYGDKILLNSAIVDHMLCEVQVELVQALDDAGEIDVDVSWEAALVAPEEWFADGGLDLQYEARDRGCVSHCEAKMIIRRDVEMKSGWAALTMACASEVVPIQVLSVTFCCRLLVATWCALRCLK